MKKSVPLHLVSFCALVILPLLLLEADTILPHETRGGVFLAISTLSYFIGALLMPLLYVFAQEEIRASGDDDLMEYLNDLTDSH